MGAREPQIIAERTVAQVSKPVAEVKLKGGVGVQGRIVASLCIASSPGNRKCYHDG